MFFMEKGLVVSCATGKERRVGHGSNPWNSSLARHWYFSETGLCGMDRDEELDYSGLSS